MFYNALCLVFLLGFAIFQGISSSDVNSKCREIHTYGYGYSQYIRLPESSHLANGSLHFSYWVMARSDAHVLLSTTSAPSSQDPVYEIVIGAGRNSFSDIRRLRRSMTKATASTKNILSDEKPQKFWIKIDSGVISVGKEGSQLSFLTWTDPQPLDIRYISFCTWTGVEGKWMYDCEGTRLETRKLSPMENLQKDLLTGYDPYAIPVMDDDTVTINADLQIRYINLDAKKMSMTFRGKFELSWFDPKLQWEPSEYDNIQTLRLTHRKIWLPEFVLVNAIGDGSDPMSRGPLIVTVTSEGDVKWSPEVNWASHCGIELSDWPWDKHKCSLELGLTANQESINMNVANNVSKVDRIGTEWDITSLEFNNVMIPVPWQEFTTDVPDDDVEPGQKALILTMDLKRRTPSFSVLLFMPLFAVFTAYLCSFWLSIVSFERIFLNGICQLLIAMLLLACDYALPAITKKTPYIMVVYSSVLLLSSVSTCVSALLLSVVRTEHRRTPPKFICKILKSQRLTAIFPPSREGNYNQLQEEVLDKSNEPEEISTDDYWNVLAKIIDAITFIASAIIFIVILS